MSETEQGNGLRFERLLDVGSGSASRYWRDIPVLMIVGDQTGSALATSVFERPLEEHSTALKVNEPSVALVETLKASRLAPVSSKRTSSLAASVFVGRLGRSDICLNHVTVSKTHACISPPELPGGMWQIQDVGSRNGTFVNGHRLARGEWGHLKFGDEVVLGSLHCIFLDSEALDDLLDFLRNTEETKTWNTFCEKDKPETGDGGIAPHSHQP